MKIKKCKGTGKAKGSGCGEEKNILRYGLCKECFKNWIFSTEQGLDILSKVTIRGHRRAVEKSKKDSREEKRLIDSGRAMKMADIYFSRYVRLLHSNGYNCTCYTCGTVFPIKQIDNGHYIKREKKSTRYHLDNCRPQCKVCNGDIKYNGKQVEFRINLVNEIGEERVLEVEYISKQKIKASASFYRDIANEYREKLNNLQIDLKVKVW